MALRLESRLVDLERRVGWGEVGPELDAAAESGERIARVCRLLERLIAFYRIAVDEMRLRGVPNDWAEYEDLRTFTHSVLQSTWNAKDASSVDEAELWFWSVLHAVHGARRRGRGDLRLGRSADAIEEALMQALLEDGPTALADAEIRRSPYQSTPPAPETFYELLAIAREIPLADAAAWFYANKSDAERYPREELLSPPPPGVGCQ